MLRGLSTYIQVHCKEPDVVESSGALHYSMPHNRIVWHVVLARETPEIFILSHPWLSCCFCSYQHFGAFHCLQMAASGDCFIFEVTTFYCIKMKTARHEPSSYMQMFSMARKSLPWDFIRHSSCHFLGNIAVWMSFFNGFFKLLYYVLLAFMP